VLDKELCIQCGKCAIVCPHAVIRIKVYDEAHLKGAPETFKAVAVRDREWKGQMYTIQVAPEDCTGCGDCVEACPKDLFTLMPLEQKLIVQCKNLLEGEEATDACAAACNACGRCAADCKTMVKAMETGKVTLASAITAAEAKSSGKAVAAVSGAGVGAETQTKMLKRLCDLIATLESRIEALEQAVGKAAATKGTEKHAESHREDVIPAMAALRLVADELETIVDAELWPLPSYAEMLFVR